MSQDPTLSCSKCGKLIAYFEGNASAIDFIYCPECMEENRKEWERSSVK